ncbi:MAG: ankyrin repeat domain-containing protein [Rhodanobacteraceae bacterium]|nr:ankyrin repeat domain-containing protein [Rhodanobacteraceae bacterium]
MLSLRENDPIAVDLVRAIRQGDASGLRQLLEDTPGLARAKVVDQKGVARSLLHLVADWPGHFPNGAQCVAVLAAAGADLDAVVINGPARETPLHWAASSDDVAVLDALLDAGANIEAPGAVFTGGSPMSDAVVFAQWKAARRLAERGARTEIWQAAALGQLAQVQQFATASPGPTAEQLTNAFWHACRGGQRPVAEYLLERGADLNWLGYERQTPLDAARKSGDAALLSWLASVGARSAGA